MGPLNIEADKFNAKDCDFDYLFFKKAVVLHNGEIDQIYNETSGDVITEGQ